MRRLNTGNGKLMQVPIQLCWSNAALSNDLHAVLIDTEGLPSHIGIYYFNYLVKLYLGPYVVVPT
jgi:hypothetical protein